MKLFILRFQFSLKGFDQSPDSELQGSYTFFIYYSGFHVCEDPFGRGNADVLRFLNQNLHEMVYSALMLVFSQRHLVFEIGLELKVLKRLKALL